MDSTLPSRWSSRQPVPPPSHATTVSFPCAPAVASASTARLGLAFILNDPPLCDSTSIASRSLRERRQQEQRTEPALKRAERGRHQADASPAPPFAVTPPLTREEKRRGRTCRVDGCDNYIVHKGRCCRHGGARKCSTPGCDCTAKYMGLCWKHGGSTTCKVEGCSMRAKSKGKCWAHGGGTVCSHVGCTKVAVSNGLCWAHGGGKRCLFDGCNRPGYERTNGFCDRHFDEVQHANYFEV